MWIGIFIDVDVVLCIIDWFVLPDNFEEWRQIRGSYEKAALGFILFIITFFVCDFCVSGW